MSDVLNRAKEVERKTSNDTNVYIRLTLLQDLIAEIEQLYASHPLREVKKNAEGRAP